MMGDEIDPSVRVAVMLRRFLDRMGLNEPQEVQSLSVDMNDIYEASEKLVSFIEQIIELTSNKLETTKDRSETLDRLEKLVIDLQIELEHMRWHVDQSLPLLELLLALIDRQIED